MRPNIEQVEVKSRAEWRAWLEAHHTQPDGIWLVTYKKHMPAYYLAWDDIVQEALCFGWIDSLPRKLDADRTMHYISPRKKGSPWSGRNKQYLRELEAAGLLHPAGIAVIQQAIADGSWTLLDDVEALIVPDDLAEALTHYPDASAHFDGFRASAKKAILWWIKSAKRPETRAKRIAQTAEKAAKNQPAKG